MTDPLISVIIPTYNRSHLIVRAIQSILNQTYNHIEVLVVDDGSTDETKKTVLSINDPRVNYIHQANQGVSAARNKGILLAKGDWIAFLDSDDLWLSKKLEIQIEKSLRENNLWCHTQENWVRNGTRVNQHKKHQKSAGRIYLDSLPLCVVSPSTVMIHKSIFKQIGGFDPVLSAAEDYDLWLRISSRHNISFCEEPLIEKHGGQSDQLSRSFLGLDRFRIRALRKQLKSPFLTQQELEATHKIYIEKCTILAQGYRKHGKTIIADFYESLIKT